jgi:hypothetical protein
VNENNRYLYLLEFDRIRVVTAEVGDYSGASLAANLQVWLNRGALRGGYLVEYLTSTNSLRISTASADGSFVLLTDAELLTVPQALTVSTTFPSGASASNPRSLNSVLGNPGGTRDPNNRFYVCTYLQTQPYDCVYLRSQHLASPDASDPNGSHDVLCKIPVDSAFGGVCTGEMPWGLSLHVGGFAHKTIDFQVTDRFRNPVLLQDGAVTFVLTFT